LVVTLAAGVAAGVAAGEVAGVAAGALFALLAFGGLMVATATLFLLSFSVSFFFDSFIFDETDDKYS